MSDIFNGSSLNSELFANLVTQAQFAAYEQSIARQLVTVFDAPANSGKVLQVPVWSSVSADLITDESVSVRKGTNTTSATITLAEHVVYHQVTDMLRDSSYSDVFAQLGDQSGRAIAESIDTQVFSHFNSLSGNVTAVASLTVGDIFDRVALLRANKLTGPFYCVVHPGAAVKLKKALTATTSYQNATAVAEGVLGGFYIGTIAGCQIFESALVPVAEGVAAGAVFTVGALGHAMRGGIDMNTLYLPASRATDVVLKATAGAAVLQAGFGIVLNTTI